MQVHTNDSRFYPDLPAHFQAVFAASDGADAGCMIAALADDLINQTAGADRYVVCAAAADDVLACAIFSRLTYADPAQTVFVMGPVAVAHAHQRRGIGGQLIRAGVDHLRDQGVDLVMTYGDPAYYTRHGFHPVTQAQIPAPFMLQYPHGWMGQALTADSLPHLLGPCQCVPAFNDPAFW